MKEKINLQELTTLLASKAGIAKKDADVFLREFFGLMTDAVIEDKIVKIKDLGTFKLTRVEDRESVNVRTGERVLIPAHSKISYVQDKNLGEYLNEDFKENTAENQTQDNVGFPILEDPKEESTELPIPGEYKHQTTPKENTEITIKTEIIPETSTIPETTEEIISEEEPEITAVQENAPETLPISETKEPVIPKEGTKITDAQENFAETPVIPEIEKQSVPEDETGIKDTEDKSSSKDIPEDIPRILEDRIKKARKKRRLKTNLVLTALLLLAGGFIYYISQQDEPELQMFNLPPKTAFELAMHDTINSLLPVPVEKATDSIPGVQPAEKKRRTHVGERLTLLALEEYGDIAFWIYIYEENKDLIELDNYVKSGIEITLPAREKYDIDPGDPASIQKARTFAKRYQ